MQRTLAPGTIEIATRVLPIRAQGVTVRRDGRCVLDNIDIELGDSASTTVILGCNGAGKSLLVRVLAGLLTADTGTVSWANTLANRVRAAKIGLVFQRPVLLRRTAAANIEFALKISGTPKDKRTLRARDILEEAGISYLAQTQARELSGGEQQRLAVARALACDPDIFFLDEPASNLDPASTAALEKMLRHVKARGIPLVLITHDLGQARRLADEVIFMHRGRICERTLAAEFFREPKSPQATAFLAGEIVI